MRRPHAFTLPHWLMPCLLIATAAAVFIVTMPPGRALDGPDSVTYVHASRDLRAGLPMRDVYGTPYVQWGPLYPVLLAPFENAYVGAWVLNLLAFCATFGLSVALARMFLTPPMTCVVAVLLLLGGPLQFTYRAAISEPLFITFIMGFLYAAARGDGWRRVGLMSGFALLALWQRMAGAMLIPLGAALLVGLNWRQRGQAVRQACVFVLLPTAGYSAWMVHGLMVLGRSGPPSLPIYTLYQSAVVAGFTVVLWLPPLFAVFTVAVLLAVFARSIRYAHTRHHRGILRSLSGVHDSRQYADRGVVPE